MADDSAKLVKQHRTQPNEWVDEREPDQSPRWLAARAAFPLAAHPALLPTPPPHR